MTLTLKQRCGNTSFLFTKILFIFTKWSDLAAGPFVKKITFKKGLTLD